jgi:hypothetical protein
LGEIEPWNYENTEMPPQLLKKRLHTTQSQVRAKLMHEFNRTS